MPHTEPGHRPDLTHLSTFLEVVRSSGFGRAADRLGLTQSAVSHRIARLEEQLAVRLFEEPRRRLIPTPAGRALLDVCGRFFSELDVLTVSISEGRVSAGPLTIACPGAFGRAVVFPAIEAAGLGGHPIRLLYRQLDDIFDLVETGGADLGIAYDVRITSTLTFTRIAKEEFCLIAPATDARADVTLDDLDAARWVAYEEGEYVFGRWFNEVFGSSPARLRADFTFSRLEEVVTSVIAGRGWSIVPLHAADAALAAGTVVTLEPAGRPRCYNPEYAVTRPGWTPRPEVDDLLAEVARIATEAQSRGRG